MMDYAARPPRGDDAMLTASASWWPVHIRHITGM
jgi:hypothetical protein